jgi:hypothetical protein
MMGCALGKVHKGWVKSEGKSRAVQKADNGTPDFEDCAAQLQRKMKVFRLGIDMTS